MQREVDGRLVYMVNIQGNFMDFMLGSSFKLGSTWFNSGLAGKSICPTPALSLSVWPEFRVTERKACTQ